MVGTLINGSYPTRYTVGVAHREVTTNGFGDEIETVGDPEPMSVFGWYVGGGYEGRPDGHVYQVEWDATMYAPTEADIRMGDRVHLPGAGEFVLVGEPSSWDNNPWFQPGLVEARLKRVGDRE